jgi:hypothetical protein
MDPVDVGLTLFLGGFVVYLLTLAFLDIVRSILFGPLEIGPD